MFELLCPLILLDILGQLGILGMSVQLGMLTLADIGEGLGMAAAAGADISHCAKFVAFIGSIAFGYGKLLHGLRVLLLLWLLNELHIGGMPMTPLGLELGFGLGGICQLKGMIGAPLPPHTDGGRGGGGGDAAAADGEPKGLQVVLVLVLVWMGGFGFMSMLMRLCGEVFICANCI